MKGEIEMDRACAKVECEVCWRMEPPSSRRNGRPKRRFMDKQVAGVTEGAENR